VTPADAFGAYSTEEQAEATMLRRDVMAPWQVRCVQEYVAAHLHAKIRMVDLAGIVQLGPYRFKRVFKASFGCTPHQYVIRQRVERALSLMIVSKDPLSQISAECGFVDQSHLSNLFRKIVGARPGTWRRIHTRRKAEPAGAKAQRTIGRESWSS